MRWNVVMGTAALLDADVVYVYVISRIRTKHTACGHVSPPIVCNRNTWYTHTHTILGVGGDNNYWFKRECYAELEGIMVYGPNALSALNI